MTGANRQLDAAIDAFAVQSDVKAAQAEQLRRAIEADDVLLKRMNDAAKQGRLRSFALDFRSDACCGQFLFHIATICASTFRKGALQRSG